MLFPPFFETQLTKFRTLNYTLLSSSVKLIDTYLQKNGTRQYAIMPATLGWKMVNFQ